MNHISIMDPQQGGLLRRQALHVFRLHKYFPQSSLCFLIVSAGSRPLCLSWLLLHRFSHLHWTVSIFKYRENGCSLCNIAFWRKHLLPYCKPGVASVGRKLECWLEAVHGASVLNLAYLQQTELEKPEREGFSWFSGSHLLLLKEHCGERFFEIISYGIIKWPLIEGL